MLRVAKGLNICFISVSGGSPHTPLITLNIHTHMRGECVQSRLGQLFLTKRTCTCSQALRDLCEMEAGHTSDAFGGFGSLESSPPSNVVFLRLAFSCFPGGQVAKLFQDSSLGNAVNIVVTRLILLMEDQVKSAKLSLLLFFNAVTGLPERPDCVRLVALAASRGMKGCKKAGEKARGRRTQDESASEIKMGKSVES